MKNKNNKKKTKSELIKQKFRALAKANAKLKRQKILTKNKNNYKI